MKLVQHVIHSLRSRGNSLPGANRPIEFWPIRCLELSSPGPFVPWLSRSLELTLGAKWQGTKRSGNERARERKRQGAIWRGSASARVLLADSLRGANCPRAKRLGTQHVIGPTHRLGGTLDVVITRNDYTPTDIVIDPPGVVSDHSLITCRLPVVSGSSPEVQRRVRAWRSVDRDVLRPAILNSVDHRRQS